MARWDREPEQSIPGWFWQAVETEATEHTVEVDECDVAFRCWGGGDKPGLLLIHGMHAHSHWWDFIAPQLTDHYNVAAMDLTGMGDSDYRYEYKTSTYAEEIVAVCGAANFDRNVTIVAHSFGGYMAVKAANLFPDRFGSLILVDSGIRHPDDPPPDRPSLGGRAKLYPDRKAAEARFRLQPPQDCANQYILEYIAKHSLYAIDGGYAWKFDDDLYDTLTDKDIQRAPEEYQNLTLPLGVIYGEDSELFSKRTLDYMRELVPNEFPAVGIPAAQHHVFLDQPQDFVRELRTLCAALRSTA